MEISREHSQFLTIQGVQVPYVVFDNSDDVTTHKGECIGYQAGAGINQAVELLQRSGITKKYQ